jgi:Cu-processing system permease protein
MQALTAIIGVTRARAFGLALFVWFFLVLFYDLLIMGAGFLLKERAANMLIFVSLFGNPIDAARVAGLISVGDATIFGAAGAALVKFLGGMSETILISTLVVWTIGPIVLASQVLHRRDL